jgi:chemotaxis protein MotB
MMAFFLMMWLMGSTTEGEKKGIADYFASPLRITLSGGPGSGDASRLVKGGGEDLTRSPGQIKRGDVASKRSAVGYRQLNTEQRKAEAARLEELKLKVEERLRQNSKIAAIMDQISLDMTMAGLRIQIIDREQRAMFPKGSAAVQPHMRELLRELGAVLAEVPNRLTLEGHTDATPFSSSAELSPRGYGNWELSADRANASRRELEAGGLPPDQVFRVLGLAASQPLDKNDATAPTNRRISLVVMTRETEDGLVQLDELRRAEPAPAAAAPVLAAPGATAAPAPTSATAR